MFSAAFFFFFFFFFFFASSSKRKLCFSAVISFPYDLFPSFYFLHINLKFHCNTASVQIPVTITLILLSAIAHVGCVQFHKLFQKVVICVEGRGWLWCERCKTMLDDFSLSTGTSQLCLFQTNSFLVNSLTKKGQRHNFRDSFCSHNSNLE